MSESPILVPYGCGRAADRAISRAIEMRGEMAGAPIVVLHVIVHPIVADERAWAREQISGWLKPRDPSIRVEVVLGHSVEEEILRAASRLKAAAIVMGCNDDQRFGAGLSTRIAEMAPCPVTVLHAERTSQSSAS